MWIIWVNLGYLGEFEKMLRVSQKIGGGFWAVLDYIRMRMAPGPQPLRDL